MHCSNNCIFLFHPIVPKRKKNKLILHTIIDAGTVSINNTIVHAITISGLTNTDMCVKPFYRDLLNKKKSALTSTN